MKNKVKYFTVYSCWLVFTSNYNLGLNSTSIIYLHLSVHCSIKYNVNHDLDKEKSSNTFNNGIQNVKLYPQPVFCIQNANFGIIREKLGFKVK